MGAAAMLALLALHFAGGASAETATRTGVAPHALVLDGGKSHVSFHLRTRWGQRIAGYLPVVGGERRILADGRHQVWMALDAAAADLEGSGRLDEVARGERFFDAGEHPRIVFLSDPYHASVVEQGGVVQGWLEIRGVRRPEVFILEPASCAEPGTGCAVNARGSIDRSAYGMDAMRLVLSGNVHFDLHLWLGPAP